MDFSENDESKYDRDVKRESKVRDPEEVAERPVESS